MTNHKIMSHVDHTHLKAYATWTEIEQLCEEALAYKTASVCVPPSYVKKIHDHFGERINICTVVGFPLGYSVLESKVAETKKALEDGAKEIDMVINLCHVKNKEFEKVQEEIVALKNICGEHILKVIIETCYLSKEEKVRLCKIVTNSGADYIKTSTGFGTGGATLEDIKLFRENIGDTVKIKAAGGIKSKQDFIHFLNEGCQRLGTSSAISLLEEKEAGEPNGKNKY